MGKERKGKEFYDFDAFNAKQRERIEIFSQLWKILQSLEKMLFVISFIFRA